MGTLITCLSIGSYRGALTRGRQYEMLGESATGNVKVRGDNGRTRWYSKHLFDLTGNPAPVLVDWQFDHPHEIINEFQSAADVSFTLDDGTERWCWFITPAHLAAQLNQPYAEPGMQGVHLIFVRSLAPAVVEAMLRHLDEQGELIAASLPVLPDVADDDDVAPA
jgi:hypothetical protein